MEQKGEFKISIEGWNCKVTSIKRYLALSGSTSFSRDDIVGEYGFRKDNMPESRDIYTAEQLIQSNGGLIVGDGDSGKTVFLRSVENALVRNDIRYRSIKLRDTGRSQKKLADKIEQILEDDVSFCLVDGVDEFPGCISTLIKTIELSSGKVKWLVTSRPLIELRQFDVVAKSLPKLSLLPFTYSEAEELALNLSGNGSGFMSAVKDVGLLEFCSKPGGLVAIIRLYRDGQFEGTNTKSILDKVLQNYCQPRSDGLVDGQILCRSDSGRNYSDILGWMALCLTLTRTDEFWLDNIDDAPTGTLPLRECITDRYSYDDLFMVLTTRAIEPMGKYRARISYAPLMGYLAAMWLSNNTSMLNIKTLLKVVAPRSELRILEVQRWLSILNPEYKAQDIIKAPEFFLKSKSAISDIGFDKYYGLLERRFAQLTSEDRQNLVNPWLPILSEFDIEAMVLNRFSSESSTEEQLEFAAEVAKRCKLRSCLSPIVKIVLNENKSETLRSKLSYALIWMRDMFPDAEEFKELRAIGNKPFHGIGYSNIVGNVLDCLWPKFISASELTKRLQKPFRSGYFGAYERFLEYSLPNTFTQSVNRFNVVDLLEWATSHLAEERPFDRLGHLARAIYTYAWKWVKIKPVAIKMVEGMLSCAEKSHSYQLPFSYKEPHIARQKWIINDKQYIKSATKRMALLKIFIENSSVEKEAIEQAGTWFYHFPLYFDSDFTRIFDEWEKSIDARPEIARKWAVALGVITMRLNGEVNIRKRRKLEKCYPEIINFNSKWLGDRKRRAEEQEKRLQSNKKKEIILVRARQRGLTASIRATLRSARSRPMAFINLSYLLPSLDGKLTYPADDITQTPNYKVLNKSERTNLLHAAEDTILRLPEKVINGGGQDESILSALIYVWKKRKPTICALPADRITILAGVIFRSAETVVNNAYALNIISEFARLARNDCFNALREVILKKAKQGLSVGSAIELWSKHMTTNEIERLLSAMSSADVAGDWLGCFLQRLAGLDKGADIVNKYFSSRLIPSADSMPDETGASLLKYAIQLFPDEYGKYFLKLTSSNRRWAKEWLPSVAYTDASAIADAFLKCKSDIVCDLFIWLENNYPDTKRSIHEMVYSPSAEDSVYDLKDLILSGLMRNCDANILSRLEELPYLFPYSQWDYLIIRCRSKVEKDAVPEALTLEDIKKIPVNQKTDNTNMTGNVSIQRIVRDGSDLRDVVIEVIKRYESMYLHGHKFAAAPEIWSEFKEGHVVKKARGEHGANYCTPKWEMRLSDHLGGYLDRELKYVIANREAQSGPQTSFHNGHGGGNHDLNVECISPDGSKLLVIIEVKGNWNQELRDYGLIEQLQNKYLEQNRMAYGIFVCECFSSCNWAPYDRRRRPIKGFANKEEAQQSLDEQLKYARLKDRISVVAIDCSLH